MSSKPAQPKSQATQTMDPYEKNTLINCLKQALAFAESMPVATSCMSCKHLRHGRLCALFDSEPPTEVKKVGCPEWQFAADVPF